MQQSSRGSIIVICICFNISVPDFQSLFFNLIFVTAFCYEPFNSIWEWCSSFLNQVLNYFGLKMAQCDVMSKVILAIYFFSLKQLRSTGPKVVVRKFETSTSLRDFKNGQFSYKFSTNAHHSSESFCSRYHPRLCLRQLNPIISCDWFKPCGTR